MIAFWSILLKRAPIPRRKWLTVTASGSLDSTSTPAVKHSSPPTVSLVHLGNGVYDITQKGKQYLAGELDARDLEGE